MAIHDAVPGIEVTVRIGDQTAQEHEIANDECSHFNPAVRLHQQQRTVTKYIEAITGKEFGINLDIRPNYVADCPIVVFEIYVDGIRVYSPIFRRSKFKLSGKNREITGIKRRGESDGVVSIERFFFAEIQTNSEFVSSAKVSEDAKVISRVGEIVVKVFRKKDAREISGRGINTYGLQHHHFVHEKALKGDVKSHGVSMGSRELIKGNIGKKYKCQYLDGEDYPLAIFRFKYRSNEALKQLHIIERTPEPEPDLVGIIDDLTAEERLELHDLAANLKKRRHGTMAGRSRNEDGDNVNSGRKKRRTSETVTTIDLTEDDE